MLVKGAIVAVLWKSTLTLLLSLAVISCAAARSDNRYNEASASLAPVAAETEPADGKPIPPAVFLDTTYTQSSGQKIVVNEGPSASEKLQNALDEASPGDVIELEAGALFIGNFTLPKKKGADWIVIRSSATDAGLSGEGTRIGPSQNWQMPKLISSNASPALATAEGAHHYRFIGIEFSITSDVQSNLNLIKLGQGDETDEASLPHDIIFDRCYIHGNQTSTLRRGIALNSARTAVIDSYISDCHEAGADSQAIAGWNGPGPFKIVNNYLEASGENVMFGGADPKIKDLVPSDIEFRQNHCFKPLSWKVGHPSFAGTRWSIKNLFELKNARRVLVEGNVFENNWPDAQTGYAILIKSVNQEGTAPWSVTRDVDFKNNIVRHTSSGINILGRDLDHPSGKMKRVRVTNNLFEDVNASTWGGEGTFLKISETVDVVIDHNTVLHTGNAISAYGEKSRGFVFTNNVVQQNSYGVKGDGTAVGDDTLEKYFPEAVFKKNIIVGAAESEYPDNNYFPATLNDVKFADQARGDFRLSDNSAFRSAGTRDSAIGCDIEALRAATAKSVIAQLRGDR